MKNHLLKINEVEVNYYEWGTQEKPTIVLLHGLAGSALYSFFELTQLLENDFHLLTIDQPGHGKSSPFINDEAYLFSNLAKWYDKIFSLLLDKPFFILGHSWGADVALHYAKLFPDQIKGVILLDGGFTFPEYQEEMSFSTVYNGWDEYMDNTKYDTFEEGITVFKLYTKWWNKNKEQMLSTIFSKNEKFELITSKFTVLSIIKAFFKEPFSTTYPFIKAPLLLIHATEPKGLNPARERGISQLKKDIKDLSIVSLNETGHMVQWDKPEVVSEEIKRWVSNI